MLRKFAFAVAGAGLALAATGCSALPGGVLGGPSVTEVMKNVVDKTRTVDTYRAEMTMSGSMGGQSMDTTSDIEYTAKPEPTYKMEMDVKGEQVVALMRGSEMVVQGDPSLGAGWMRMDMGESGMDQAQDPVAEVEKLLAGENVEEVGSEDVNGAATTKYAGSYTIEEALAKVQDAEAKDAARKVYDESGIKQVDFQVWVGEDGLPRRVQSAAGEKFDSTIDFVEFNQPVDIEYPAESEITDMDDMLNDLGGGAGVPDTGAGVPDTGGY